MLAATIANGRLMQTDALLLAAVDIVVIRQADSTPARTMASQIVPCSLMSETLSGPPMPCTSLSPRSLFSLS